MRGEGKRMKGIKSITVTRIYRLSLGREEQGWKVKGWQGRIRGKAGKGES